jgi:hypothetical protein
MDEQKNTSPLSRSGAVGVLLVFRLGLARQAAVQTRSPASGTPAQASDGSNGSGTDERRDASQSVAKPVVTRQSRGTSDLAAR